MWCTYIRARLFWKYGYSLTEWETIRRNLGDLIVFTAASPVPHQTSGPPRLDGGRPRCCKGQSPNHRAAHSQCMDDSVLYELCTTAGCLFCLLLSNVAVLCMGFSCKFNESIRLVLALLFPSVTGLCPSESKQWQLAATHSVPVASVSVPTTALFHGFCADHFVCVRAHTG